ncbi:MAG: indolepyruvate oxidoreductase subunit beta [Oscillospiraceae bacterium]|nr:indolepyruvate oxidoreductase subunit beta [Oscillospiraceae bacterium]
MNCLLCGVGGQGTVLASRLIAQCALDCGAFARTSETIGMAQRGGSVVSHVRWRGGSISLPSPLIPLGGADVLIGFEPGEAVRCLPYLKRDGAAVVSVNGVTSAVASLSGAQPSADVYVEYLRKTLPRLILLDGISIAREAGSEKTLNMALLGAASSLLGFSAESMLDALRARLSPRLIEINRRALELGAAIAGAQPSIPKEDSI